MNFAENLKTVRRNHNLSQEELAELLNVSRQAVSKWEQGAGYPEMEKMILLSQKLDVSLDYLVYGENKFAEQKPDSMSAAGKITIKSPNTKAIIHCSKVLSSPAFNRVFKSKTNSPRYILFGVDGSSQWGEHSTVLGWYADEERINREIDAILSAMKRGEPYYELQHDSRVKHRFLSVKLEE